MADIADILASVSGGPLIPQSTLDLQAITRAWVNERTAPELLPYPSELVDRTMQRIARQVRFLAFRAAKGREIKRPMRLGSREPILITEV